jgi:predicted metal-binding protein
VTFGVFQVCYICQRPAAPVGPQPEGTVILAQLRQLLAENGLTDRIGIETYGCLGNCRRRCTVALAGPERWSWLFGDLDPQEDLTWMIAFARQWLDAPNGSVPKPQRSAEAQAHGVGRLPPLRMSGSGT